MARDRLGSCDGRSPALAQCAGRSRSAACEARGWAGPGPGSGRSKPERTCRHGPLRHASRPLSPHLAHLFRLRFPSRFGSPEKFFHDRTERFGLVGTHPPHRSEKAHLPGLWLRADKLLARRPGRTGGKGRAGLDPTLLQGKAVAFGVNIALMSGRANASSSRAAVAGWASDFECRVARPLVATERTDHRHCSISASSARARALLADGP